LVLLSRREADLLYTAGVRDHFRRWGIELEERQSPPPLDTGEDARIQIGVSAVPNLIESKVSSRITWSYIITDRVQLLQGNELQDVLKSILGEVEMNGAPSWHSGDVDESVEELAPRWLRAWRKCPNSLLALVNSKACRGSFLSSMTHGD
jgi:DNA mismatch repair protein MLH3